MVNRSKWMGGLNNPTTHITTTTTTTTSGLSNWQHQNTKESKHTQEHYTTRNRTAMSVPLTTHHVTYDLAAQCLYSSQKYHNSFTNFPQTRHGNSSPVTAAGGRWGWDGGALCLTVAGGCALTTALEDVHATNSLGASATTNSLGWTQQIFLLSFT